MDASSAVDDGPSERATFSAGSTRRASIAPPSAVQLAAPADSSPIYLHCVQIGGASHDAFFVTTTYGQD